MMAKKSSKSTRIFIEGELDAPISEVYPVIDTDLGRDNLENDLGASDLQNL